MSVIQAPSLSAIRAGGPGSEAWERGVELLQMTQQHLRNRSSAEAVFDRGSQYSDFVRDIEQGLSRLISNSWGRSIGQLLNYRGYLDQGEITEQQWQQAIQSMEGDIAGQIQEQLPWLEDYVGGLVDAGFVSPSYIDTYNSALEQALTFYPELANEVDFLEGGTGQRRSAQDFVNQVTGVQSIPGSGDEFGREITPTNTSTDPNSYTGWMKQTFEQALAGDGNVFNYAPDFVLDSRNLRATLDYMQQAVDGTLNGEITYGAGQGDQTGGQTGGTGQTGGQTGVDLGGGNRGERIQQAIDYINSQNIPGDLKQLYIQAVQNWDPSQELNIDNIISTFNQIKNDTIDPRFRGLVNLATAELQSAKQSIEQNRALELEQEGVQAQQAIRGAQGNLEASGMTFSGEGVRQLGQESAVGGRIPFGGTDIPEGLIPQSNRLISTSSQARYQDTLSRLARGAEGQLGTQAAQQLGFDTVGSVTGSLPESQQAAEAGALGNLLNQQIGNVAQRENINFNL